MKYIFLNLKRFDIPAEKGGVNRSADGFWGESIIRETLDIENYKDAEFAVFLPEAHLLPALTEKQKSNSIFHIGCQGVYRDDVEPGKNFGAFTTNRPASAMESIGVDYTIIGHCEERKDKLEIMQAGGQVNKKALNSILNREIKAAQKEGLKVLYCIGETADEQADAFAVLEEQLTVGLDGVDLSQIVIGYEPVWAIGPGKTPPDAPYIQKIARFVKEKYPSLEVVYGGGLKQDNAKMLAGIPEIDGGLIALTRFSGDFGFYPDEFLSIVDLYLS